MGIPHGCPLACDPAWDTEEMITKQFMIDGMLIAVAAPDDYAGPLEFYSANLPDVIRLLSEVTGLRSEEALRQAANDNTIVALSTDRRWIAMVHGNPEGEYWVEIIERSGDEGLDQ